MTADRAVPLPATSSSPRAQVVAVLREWIAHGRFGRGQPLPAERVLAKQLRVARVTVRSALGELAREGLLDSPPGRKRRVADLAERGFMEQTVAMLSTVQAGEAADAPRHGDAFIQYQAARIIEQAGLHVLTLNPQRLLDGGLSHLLAQRPAGVLVTNHVGDSDPGQRIISACAAQGLRVVAYGYSPALRDCDLVTADQAEGSKALTEWLIARGRRRILRLWRCACRPHWLEQRDLGYERAMRVAGLPPLPAVHTKDLPGDANDRAQFADLVRGIAAYLVEHICGPEPIDAVMVASDPHANQVAAACRLFGKKPNHDIDIVGYDNNWHHEASRRWEPEGPLATVDKGDQRIAAELAGMLLARLAGELPAEPQRRVVAGTLIELARGNPAAI